MGASTVFEVPDASVALAGVPELLRRLYDRSCCLILLYAEPLLLPLLLPLVTLVVSDVTLIWSVRRFVRGVSLW